MSIDDDILSIEEGTHTLWSLHAAIAVAAGSNVSSTDDFTTSCYSFPPPPPLPRPSSFTQRFVLIVFLFLSHAAADYSCVRLSCLRAVAPVLSIVTIVMTMMMVVVVAKEPVLLLLLL